MTRNIGPGSAALREASVLPLEKIPQLAGRSVVLIGLMGAGKTSIGRRLAARLGLPFRDADAEIELAAGRTIPELFARFGEPEFRDGERRVIRRLLAGDPLVLATGGGAFMDRTTRSAVRDSSISVWLRCPLPTLVRRVASRSNRPLLANGDPAEILAGLMEKRHPVYAEADIVVDCGDEPPDVTMGRVVTALENWEPPRRLPVTLATTAYNVVIGSGLLARAGAHMAEILPQKRAVIVTDETVAALHLPALLAGLDETGIAHSTIVVPPGEASKSLESYTSVVGQVLDQGVERRTAIVALGGGVVGDLAGFVAATLKRGLRFVQIPTSLLAQVDSSVGGKTGINAPQGKNLVGAFHQPALVLADTGCLDTLSPREFRAGYAEVAKYGLIDDAAFFDWLDANRGAIFGENGTARLHAVAQSCRAKAAVVARDEHEHGDRALLNLGHTFGHALERLTRYDGARLVHGEAVAIGIALAFRFSAAAGLCPAADAARVAAHFRAVGLPTRIGDVPGWTDGPEAILDAMMQDKKVSRGRLNLILARGIGRSFIAPDIKAEAVRGFLDDELVKD